MFEKTKIKGKEAGVGPFFQKTTLKCYFNEWLNIVCNIWSNISPFQRIPVSSHHPDQATVRIQDCLRDAGSGWQREDRQRRVQGKCQLNINDTIMPLNHGKLQLEINDELTQKLGKRQLYINVVKINDPNLGKFQPDIRCN